MLCRMVMCGECVNYGIERGMKTMMGMNVLRLGAAVQEVS